MDLSGNISFASSVLGFNKTLKAQAPWWPFADPCGGPWPGGGFVSKSHAIESPLTSCKIQIVQQDHLIAVNWIHFLKSNIAKNMKWREHRTYEQTCQHVHWMYFMIFMYLQDGWPQNSLRILNIKWWGILPYSATCHSTKFQNHFFLGLFNFRFPIWPPDLQSLQDHLAAHFQQPCHWGHGMFDSWQ